MEQLGLSAGSLRPQLGSVAQRESLLPEILRAEAAGKYGQGRGEEGEHGLARRFQQRPGGGLIAGADQGDGLGKPAPQVGVEPAAGSALQLR